jgi:nucleoside-triphosphatase THEP1
VELQEERLAPAVFVLTGQRGSGKTSSLQKLTAELRTRGIAVGGILAPAVFDGPQRIGYDLMDLASGIRQRLCSVTIPSTGLSQGPYQFLPDTFRWGTQLLASHQEPPPAVLCIDELGPLELAGGGWSLALEGILQRPPRVLILTVRPSLAVFVLKRWGLRPQLSWQAGVDDPGQLLEAITRAARGGASGPEAA